MNDSKLILNEIKTITTELLGDNLTGIYVHGSYAFGCFNWDKSDIDYLAVVKRPMTLSEKTKYIAAITALNEKAPPKGIEMSVVLEKHCRHFIHPTPYELHFSNAHLVRIEKDLTAYCKTMHGLDPDLAAHFTVTRAAGIALCGKDIAEVFAPVPEKACLDSIRRDVENAAEDILENPIYVILNLCRVLAFQKEHSVLSKAQGGAWGLKHLPEQYHKMIEAALICYGSDSDYPIEVYRKTLQEFAENMLHRIFLD